MDIGGLVGGILQGVGDVIGIASNPVEAFQFIALGAACIFLGIPVLDAIFKALDKSLINKV